MPRGSRGQNPDDKSDDRGRHTPKWYGKVQGQANRDEERIREEQKKQDDEDN